MNSAAALDLDGLRDRIGDARKVLLDIGSTLSAFC